MLEHCSQWKTLLVILLLLSLFLQVNFLSQKESCKFGWHFQLVAALLLFFERLSSRRKDFASALNQSLAIGGLVRPFLRFITATWPSATGQWTLALTSSVAPFGRPGREIYDICWVLGAWGTSQIAIISITFIKLTIVVRCAWWFWQTWPSLLLAAQLMPVTSSTQLLILQRLAYKYNLQTLAVKHCKPWRINKNIGG